MNPDRPLVAKRRLLKTVKSPTQHQPSKSISVIPDAGAGDRVRPCKGQAVYVYDAEKSWREAIVLDEDHAHNMVTVKLEDTEQIASCCAGHVLLCSKAPLEDVNNLTHITPVHEASVLSCLHKRFAQGRYYTNAGSTVVAVNPFTDVSHLYSREQIHAYHSRQQDLPPHIYPVAEAAYTSLVRELGKVNQSIIISGESGAGKTVSAKHLLRYLTVVSNPAAEPRVDSSDHRGVKIEQRILDSNPILEAFGNAATPRNNNSSRFGKFIELQFLRSGHIQGGSIETYLLEKTRVMHQGQGENNFHVFYQMTGLKDCSEEEEFPDWVKGIQAEVSDVSFTCVPHNQDCSANGDITETLDAMIDIGLSQDMQEQVFQVLMAVLHLGNLRFVQVNDDSSDLEASFMCERALERSCQLLGIEPSCLKHTLLHRSLQAGTRNRQSVFVKPIGIQEARSRRDCLAMLLYSRLFEWLVGFINMQIKADSFDNTIGLLDIYGFEAFATNSLEQLCINYANERLQQYYVAQFLENLQKEYTEECLQWVPVACMDNRPCVNILDGRASIFSLLNEEVYLNRKSDAEALKDRLLQLCGHSHNALRPVRRSAVTQPSFVVQHYAGEVQYCVEGLITKNKDDIPSDLVSLLTASDNGFVNQLFASYAEPESPAGRKKKTVLTKFKSSLDELLSSMGESDIHYIRCLKPNNTSTSGLFQPGYVLQQLKACGAIETVNICRRGYPARMPYSEFQQRYNVLLRLRSAGTGCHGDGLGQDEGEQKENICDPLDLLLRQQLEFPASPKRTPTPRKRLRRRTGLTQHDHARKVCRTILQAMTPHLDLQHQFGCTKLFLTEHQLELLECARLQALTHNAVVLQSAWRGLCCRKWYKQVKAVGMISHAWLTFKTRQQYLCLKQAAVVLQRGVRYWLHHLQLKREEQAAIELTAQTFTQPEPYVRKRSLSPRQSSTTTSAIESLETSRGSSETLQSLHMDGNLSDDSGVMMHEPVCCQQPGRKVEAGRGRKREGAVLQVPHKRRRLLALAAQLPQLKDVNVGDGVVTRRRIPVCGARFHTRESVLKYSHLTNRRDLPSGLTDAIQDCHDQMHGSSVDP
ncbi:unconventional myosin-XIX-like isoform X2 [Littorina saxatilis]|uniref:unconventional myosin-XIX-like isoform X2 n=1 Tax=Littorina saxatilis TaxID=31220 RepID=UPI0038B52936